MLSPHDPTERHIVTEMVRRAAAHADEQPTVIRVGQHGPDVFYDWQQIPAHPGATHADVLTLAAALVPFDPPAGPVSACALVLRDRHICYLKHSTAPMTTMPLGPEPRDDPGTRHLVEAGLTALMQVYLDAPAVRGRAFPATPEGAAHATPAQPGVRNGWTPPAPTPPNPGPRR